MSVLQDVAHYAGDLHLDDFVINDIQAPRIALVGHECAPSLYRHVSMYNPDLCNRLSAYDYFDHLSVGDINSVPHRMPNGIQSDVQVWDSGSRCLAALSMHSQVIHWSGQAVLHLIIGEEAQITQYGIFGSQYENLLPNVPELRKKEDVIDLFDQIHNNLQDGNILFS